MKKEHNVLHCTALYALYDLHCTALHTTAALRANETRSKLVYANCHFCCWSISLREHKNALLPNRHITV